MNRLYGNNKKALDLDEIIKISDTWKPYRSVACWFLWRSIDSKEVLLLSSLLPLQLNRPSLP